MAETASAIGKTQNAWKQLDAGKNKEALAALERATRSGISTRWTGS